MVAGDRSLVSGNTRLATRVIVYRARSPYLARAHTRVRDTFLLAEVRATKNALTRAILLRPADPPPSIRISIGGNESRCRKHRKDWISVFVTGL